MKIKLTLMVMGQREKMDYERNYYLTRQKGQFSNQYSV